MPSGQTFHQLANDLLDPLPAPIKRKDWEIYKSCGSAPGHVTWCQACKLATEFHKARPPPHDSWRIESLNLRLLGCKGPVNRCALKRLTTRPQPRSTPSQDSSPCEMNLSNSVLTLYGLILAPILNLFKLRFELWELNCSFKPKICS